MSVLDFRSERGVEIERISTASVVALLLIIGASIRLYNIELMSPIGDEVNYTLAAKQVLDKPHTILYGTGTIYFFPPLYVYTVAALQATGIGALLSGRLVSAIFGLLNVGAVMFLAQVVFKRAEVSIASGLWLAILPLHVQYSCVAHVETEALFFVLLFYALFLKGLNEGDRRWVFLSGIILGLAMWVKEPSLVAAIVAMLYWVWKKKRDTFGDRFFLTFLTSWLAIVIPLLIIMAVSRSSYIHELTRRTDYMSGGILSNLATLLKMPLWGLAVSISDPGRSAVWIILALSLYPLAVRFCGAIREKSNDLLLFVHVAFYLGFYFFFPDKTDPPLVLWTGS